MSTVLTATPGQTVGPFFGFALQVGEAHELVPPGYPGAIQLHGRVTDGEGAPVPDALLEICRRTPRASCRRRRDRSAATAGPSPGGGGPAQTPVGTTVSPR